MKDPATGVDTNQVVWWHNWAWQPMPHRYFLTNNINQHFRKDGKATRNKQQVKIGDKLSAGQEIVINHLLFKLKTTTVTPTPEVANG